MSESKRKSRLPRTGTLVLIAVVLLIGGGALMVWLPYHRNQVAIAEVERHGGRAYSEIVRPAWIPDAVDDGRLWVFERVIRVDLAVTQFSDEGLGYLQGLTNLNHLDLFDTQVTDAGLKHLRGQTNLQFLDLTSTHVSDLGLRHLQKLLSLESLLIGQTQVTQAGIDELQKALPHCSISDALRTGR
ncbi:Leucine Rich repeats (2 copies) [Symmachiella dynata]|uniref:hypothetical protein n=1 Tax=Symmachiella dynata TaxID=2527995 RepID=UPI001188043B|nr:hypothetical protein [Symmachiella dynata]QDT48113.1 Leucine Rich repeats (2 copies) [Symmachiella dynata]